MSSAEPESETESETEVEEHDTEDGGDAGDDADDNADALNADENFEQDDYGEPFEGRSFGGQFVWASAPGYTCKILRVRPGERVLVSTRGRKDMVVMLTGGRAVLEVIDGDDADRVEMMPAQPIAVHPDREHRLIAMSEVEMFTVYSPLSE